jgi:uncharacterized LabA/DUF88 family protein
VKGKRLDIEFGIGSSEGVFAFDAPVYPQKVYTDRDFEGWIPKLHEELYAQDSAKCSRKAISKKGRYEPTALRTIVLWDIENVSFRKDEVTVNNLLKRLGFEKAVKFVCFRDRHKKIPTEYFLHPNNPEYRLVKLRRLGWRIESGSTDADNTIQKLFRQYKHKIDALVLITADSDFKSICKEAKRLGVRTLIANNTKTNSGGSSWFESFEYIHINTGVIMTKDNTDIKNDEAVKKSDSEQSSVSGIEIEVKPTIKTRVLDFFRPHAYMSDVMRAIGLALLIAGMMAIADGKHIATGAITAFIGLAIRVQFKARDRGMKDEQ